MERYYIRLEERQKNKKLFDLLDMLEFNQAREFGVWFEPGLGGHR